MKKTIIFLLSLLSAANLCAMGPLQESYLARSAPAPRGGNRTLDDWVQATSRRQSTGSSSAASAASEDVRLALVELAEKRSLALC